MIMTVTLPIILSQLLQASTSQHCAPNTTFFSNGQLCLCDATGRWNKADCKGIGRRRLACQPGLITWQGCQQCICQENGEQLCNNVGCLRDKASSTTLKSDPYLGINVNSIGIWCTPFHSYFIDCKICVCPVSGRSVEAHCAQDASCQLNGIQTIETLISDNKVCLPKVTYLFPCFQCLCSDRGSFVKEKCVQKCQKTKMTGIDLTKRHCTPQTLFKHGNNICHCPETGQINELYCTKSNFSQLTRFKNLNQFGEVTSKCIPHSFTKTRCIYCECQSHELMNENLCHELPCLDIFEVDYTNSGVCKPGEIIAICTECFCLSGGITNGTYCTKTCSYQSRLGILEKILKESPNKDLININAIPKLSPNEQCVANTVYIDQGRFCLCPQNSHTYFKICTSHIGYHTEAPTDSSTIMNKLIMTIAPDAICEPNTFVESNCNTCFCPQRGKIDPKWCTYDDCNAKREVFESNKNIGKLSKTRSSEDTCIPRTIMSRQCNFCICSDTGLIADSPCTNSKCSNFNTSPSSALFSCEPLAYYEIGCNICLCPRDGMKNLKQCTRNSCDKGFLNNNVCAAGSLFSEDCNICICPPNGIKSDKLCTNDTCNDSTAGTWKSIFKHSDILLRNQPEEVQRYIDLCFPGEQFAIGCKLCVCPEMGLRSYATCHQLLCDEELIKDAWSSGEIIGEYRFNGDTPNLSFRDSFADINFFMMGRRLMDPVNSTFENTLYGCETPGKIMDKCFVCNCEEEKKTINVEHCLKSDHSECEDAIPTFLNDTNKPKPV